LAGGHFACSFFQLVRFMALLRFLAQPTRL
jgi:hypothetical protein